MSIVFVLSMSITLALFVLLALYFRDSSKQSKKWEIQEEEGGDNNGDPQEEQGEA